MPITGTALLIGLTLFGSIAPLLTFAHLWQIKEWRLDRLREHLRSEGYYRQIFGIARPLVAIPFILLVLAGGSPRALTVLLLAIFAAITGIQSVLRKQPKPVWTKKARLLVLTTLLCTAGLSFAALLNSAPFALPAIVLLQPVFLADVWILLLPLDRTLKKRILRRASQLRSRWNNGTVIGITGSAGKTTTKELLAHILAERHPLGTPTHVNTEMGVAQWLIHTVGDTQGTPSILIVEMGAYHRGEIALLCGIVRPTMGIVTYIGAQHIALFGSQEEVCQAKGELIDALPKEGHAFLNADNQRCAALSARAACPVTTVGTGGAVDIEACEVEETGRGIRFRIRETIFEIPLHGTHNVTNVLLAIAAAEHLGMTRDSIAKRLRSFTPPEHTFNVRSERGITILDDTHNASPASFQAALQWAHAQPAERKVLLTSGLIELGEEQDRTHTEIGAMAAPIFDRVIFLSKQSAKPFRNGYGKPVEIFDEHVQPITPSTLLVCVGRMSTRTMRKLLPPSAS